MPLLLFGDLGDSISTTYSLRLCDSAAADSSSQLCGLKQRKHFNRNCRSFLRTLFTISINFYSSLKLRRQRKRETARTAELPAERAPCSFGYIMSPKQAASLLRLLLFRSLLPLQFRSFYRNGVNSHFSDVR